MHNLSFDRKKIIKYVHLVFMCVVLYTISKQNYMLLDSTVEVVTVVFGIILMLIALTTIKRCDNKYFHFIAFITSVFGIISLLADDYNESFPLSILLQYYECIVINLSVVYINKKLNWRKIFILNIILVVVCTLSIIILKDLVLTYSTNHDLTLFYYVSGFLFTLNFSILFFRVLRSKDNNLKNNRSGFMGALFLKILACLSFTLFNNLNSIFNILGHIFMNIAYYHIFNGLLNEILINPYDTLFKKLKDKAEELEIINKKLDKVNYRAENMEKLNEKFINLIPDGILIIRNMKIESVNHRLLNMFGVNDKIELEDLNFNEIIDSAYLEKFKSRILSMDSSILEKPQEYQVTWKKTKKWVEATSLIVNDENGEYVISAIRNIEDRKRAEESEKLLALKNKEENIKNDFFANISHELKTPINVIYSATQVQNDFLKEDNSEEHILKYNKIIKQNCLRLMRLINNIIDITRIESSFFKPNYKIENIIFVVEEITMSIVEYAKSKNFELIFDTEVEEAYVNCDSDLIERIILNLLSNAVKYGKESGNIQVYIYKNSEDSISISVKDDGIGIPDDMKRSIFDRFLKVDNTLSRKTEGSGIGLSLVKQLVEIHQGTITCHSKLNVGTEFKIILPTVEYSLSDISTNEKLNSYSKRAIEPAEIEFSDIYY